MSGSMTLNLDVFWKESGKGKGFYHILKFKNDNYKKQKELGGAIQYEL